ncbi:helix-turn-helix domain-containing protein [Bradyrhizobium sp. CCGE-LA001]|uniref:helix-turn-helix domain-containing protein n=1 Tax=Bradyrhizobium sp. CCGE-LA001 TaxID=1223566 RepID=UPI0002AA728C|nr:helix-turn-helix transcriptional regulator [Bradyrhizobium sp. CCGE-LA001]AMA56226.1 XRE family transcriptional regulator [Bradyrhizobium sp. CCGE-LA001]
MPTILGTKIRRLRTEKKLSLDQLAELTGSSKSYIWELENKNPPRPSAAKLAEIANKLDTTLEFLLDSGGEISTEDATDAKFYRQYRQMDPSTKAKIRQMVKLWSDDT